MPTVATLSGAGERSAFVAGSGRGMRLLLFATLPLTTGALAVGPESLKLVYGSDYGGTGTVLRLLLIPLPLVCLLGLASAVVMALGKLKINLLTMLAALLNIGLDIALIPGHGAVGAAVANACAQVAGSAPMIVYATLTVGGRVFSGRFLGKAAVVAAGTGITALAAVESLGGVLGVLVGVAIGIAAFVALSRLLRVLPAGDAAWLDQAAGSRLRGSVGKACRAWAELPGT